MTRHSQVLARWFFNLTVSILLLSAAAMSARAGADFPAPGFRPLPPGTHALVGARVVVKPGQVLDKATVIIRDGLIQSVGANVTIPADARVWDMQGLTIYAGFIDSYLSLPPK